MSAAPQPIAKPLRRQPFPPLLHQRPRLKRDWIGAFVCLRRTLRNRLMHIPRNTSCRVSGYRAGSGMVLRTKPCPCCQLGARVGGVMPYDVEYLGHPESPLDPPLPGVQRGLATDIKPLLRAGDGLAAAEIEQFRRKAREIRDRPLVKRPLRLQRDWPEARVRLVAELPAIQAGRGLRSDDGRRVWPVGEIATVLARRKTELTLLGDPCLHCGLREIREEVPTEAVEYLGHLALPSEVRAEPTAT